MLEAEFVLAAVGLKENGDKVLLGLWLRGAESTNAWEGVLAELVGRGLVRPQLVIIDGNPGLRAAVEAIWPKIEVQRCVVHKLRNLLAHAPKHTHEAIKEDYHAIIYAVNREQALAAWDRFEKKWRKQCPGVVKSLLEAEAELLTFFCYPESQWKSLRSTNIIERIYGEFRRRIKTPIFITFRRSGVDTSLWSFCQRSDCDAANSGLCEMPACATADRNCISAA